MNPTQPPTSVEFAGSALERLWAVAQASPRGSDFVPQANDVEKVLEIVASLKLDVIDAVSVAEYFRFNRRQALYYIEAARELGLLEKLANHLYKVSQSGERIRSSDGANRLFLFTKSILGLPVILRVLAELRDAPGHTLSQQRVVEVVSSVSPSRYRKSTLPRRTASVLAWLRWLENNSEFLPVGLSDLD